MSNFKRSLYTFLLVFTCLFASPFIWWQIWKTGKEQKPSKTPDPPAVGAQAKSGNSSQSEPEKDTAEKPTGADGSETPTSADGTQPGTAAAPTEAAAVSTEPYNGFILADSSYFDDALFIGDSRTVGLRDYGTLKNADYFCSVGLSATGITKNNEAVDGVTFDTKIDGKHYGKVYIMLGINEVGNDLEGVITYYRAIVEKVKAHQPDAIVYVCANLRVSQSAETSVISNTSINTLNSMISQLADNKKVFYIDINALFDDGTGYLTEAYTFDGVHPLAEHYPDWCDWLCSKAIPYYAAN
ncbi:MAG: lipase [Ruminococcus sp.]|nr:lipase [Ruminococcus sp.]